MVETNLAGEPSSGFNAGRPRAAGEVCKGQRPFPDLRLIVFALLVAAGISACGGGGGGSAGPAGPSSVTIAWDANRESGVNRVGGGYQVMISGQPFIDVPYVSGPAAPTSITLSLEPGRYSVTVRAYAALDSPGGNTGSLSAESQVLTLDVP